MITWTLENVTPEMAAKWLGKNDVNRALREHRAAFIARSIADKKWVTTHQAIAFSRSGRLLDGQHRLRAIIMANESVLIWVARNVPEEAFGVMDSGLPRQMHERIGSDKRRTAIACTMFRALRPGRPPHNYEVSLLLDLLEPSFIKIESIPKINRSSKVTRAPVMAAAILRVADCQEGSQRQLSILDSIARLVNGDLSGSPKAIVCLYRQLYETIAEKSTGSNANEMFSRAFYAFDQKNANISKIQIKDISVHLGEAREIFNRISEDIFNGG